MKFNFFSRYAIVGVLNTLIHWGTFAICFEQGMPQSYSNLIAFCTAVTCSFFVNARWTFNSEATFIRYLMYVVFMGMVALTIGYCADALKVSSIVTLVFFSATSLVCGFTYSKIIVFKEDK